MGITIQNPPPKNPNPDPDEVDLSGKQMSFLEHLEELRVRLLRSIYSILVTTGVCFWKHQAIYAYMARPLTDTLRALGTCRQSLFIPIPLIPSIFTSSSPSWGGFFSLRPSFFISSGCLSHPDFTATKRNTFGLLS